MRSTRRCSWRKACIARPSSTRRSVQRFSGWRTDMATDLDRFTEACNYPGTLNKKNVEENLRSYLDALGVKREIVHLEAGWRVEEHPPLEKAINAVLNDIVKRNPAFKDARAALAAIDAIDARDARDAIDARNA